MKQNALSPVLQLSVSQYASCPLPFCKEGLDGGPKVSCQLKFWPFVRKRARLLTVWVPLFFRKIARIERLPVRAAILVSCVPRGGRWGL